MIKGYVEDKSDWESQNRSCCKNSWFFLQNVPFASDGVILQFRYITDDLSAEEEGGGTAFVKGELVSIAFETGEKSHVIELWAQWRVNRYAVPYRKRRLYKVGDAVGMEDQKHCPDSESI
jgi:hypothetical protein